jgi:hypothetical protein
VSTSSMSTGSIAAAPVAVAAEHVSKVDQAAGQSGWTPPRAERAIEHRIAHGRVEEEGADAFFVCERRRSSRIPSAIRRERSEQLK